jgi:hypothetical protein
MRIRDAADRIRRVTHRDEVAATAALSRCVAQVRDAALRTFETIDRPHWRRFVEASGGGGLPLAALSVCGRGTREIRYTQLLGYFLDPRKPHGLGSKVLRAVLSPELANPDTFDFDHAVVTPEQGLGEVVVESVRFSSTVDLFIEAGGFYVLIEQKIGSAEGVDKGAGNQLAKYARTVLQHHPYIEESNSLWLYLTPRRAPPRDGAASVGFPQWRAVSHSDWFRRIAAVLDGPGLSRVARHNLCCLLWDLMMGPLAVDEDKLEVLRSYAAKALDRSERFVALEQWCGANSVHTDVMLKIMEVCYADDTH